MKKQIAISPCTLNVLHREIPLEIIPSEITLNGNLISFSEIDRFYLQCQKNHKLVSNKNERIRLLSYFLMHLLLESRNSDSRFELLLYKHTIAHRLYKNVQDMEPQNAVSRFETPVFHHENIGKFRPGSTLSELKSAILKYADNEPQILKHIQDMGVLEALSYKSASTNFSRLFETFCKTNKFNYIKAFFEAFETDIDLKENKLREIRFLPLVTNFYHLRGMVVSTDFQGCVDTYLYLKEKLGNPPDVIDIPATPHIPATRLTLSEYVWLNCANIPKKNYITNALQLDPLDSSRKEELCIGTIAWLSDNFRNGVPLLSAQALYYPVAQLMDIYTTSPGHNLVSKISGQKMCVRLSFTSSRPVQTALPL